MTITAADSRRRPAVRLAADAAVGARARGRRPVPGAGAASVPYFVLDRHYGYVAASGLTLAATLGSSVPQPFLGVLVDRRTRAGWPGRGRPGRARAERRGPVPRATARCGRDPAVRDRRGHVPPGGGQGRPPGRGGQRRSDEPLRGGRQRRLLPRAGAGHPGPDRLGLPATALFMPPAVLICFVLLRRHRREAPPTPPRRRGPVATGGGRSRP